MRADTLPARRHSLEHHQLAAFATWLGRDQRAGLGTEDLLAVARDRTNSPALGRSAWRRHLLFAGQAFWPDRVRIGQSGLGTPDGDLAQLDRAAAPATRDLRRIGEFLLVLAAVRQRKRQPRLGAPDGDLAGLDQATAPATWDLRGIGEFLLVLAAVRQRECLLLWLRLHALDAPLGAVRVDAIDNDGLPTGGYTLWWNLLPTGRAFMDNRRVLQVLRLLLWLGLHACLAPTRSIRVDAVDDDALPASGDTACRHVLPTSGTGMLDWRWRWWACR